ncbi:MAG: PhoH family protein [Planctomycetes bacterium]|nr:PhoH family protein [Planctomycetota bacterium]
MELTITLEDAGKRAALFGSADRHLRLIRGALGVHISARDSSLKVSGSARAVGQAASIIEDLQRLLRDRDFLTDEQVAETITHACRQLDAGPNNGDIIEVYSRTATLQPRTEGQRAYLQAIRRDDLVFCMGPAGTGKTYLAVAMAVSMLKAGAIHRIVHVRPAVEAGEKLGFLPGDMQAKVNPYLRPLFDAMYDMMPYEQIQRFLTNDVIEIAPLAFMRGRTLNNALIILDEAQNTTVSQMLMFLTRLGNHSKMVVTGDDSQVDLERPEASGMIDAVRRLEGIRGISTIRLAQEDIVRHRLVQNIVTAYANGNPRTRQNYEVGH